jgi:acyl-CoA thioesterase FadM
MRSLRAKHKAWILSLLHLTIDRLPRWEEEIVVETWPSGLDGLRATREFVLSVEGAAAARATSAWLVFDTERRQPARLPADHLDAHACTEMRLQFRAEATLDDIVRSAVQIDDTDAGHRVRHALRRAEDEQVLLAAATRWAPHPNTS